MRKKLNSKQRNYIIVGLCMVLVIMGVGYAAFQSQLKISGTSNIASNFNVKITSITPNSIIGTAENKTEVTTYNDTSATFGVSLKSPGDSITYDITIVNQGTIDAVLKTITKTDASNSAILFETSGVNEGDELKVGETATMKVKVTYNPSVTSQPNILDSTLKLTLDYAQKGTEVMPGTNNILLGGKEVEIVTEGDGLYVDSTRAGRYVYKGANPNNYITFNNETWRIVAKETDGTYKIVRNELLPDPMPFDNDNFRDKESNGAGGTYCANSSYGCNAWAANKNLIGSPAEFTNTRQTGTVLLDSSLNTYLNTTYLNSIQTNADKIVSHNWGVGAIYTDASFEDDDDMDISEFVDEETKHFWNGKVALLSPSDTYLAASNEELCGTLDSNYDNMDICGANNYLIIPESEKYWLTLSPTCNTTFYVNEVGGANLRSGYYADEEDFIRPALYLSSSIQLQGTGSELDPFIIIN